MTHVSDVAVTWSETFKPLKHQATFPDAGLFLRANERRHFANTVVRQPMIQITNIFSEKVNLWSKTECVHKIKSITESIPKVAQKHKVAGIRPKKNNNLRWLRNGTR